MALYVGLDVGSISADLVVVSDEREVLDTRYVRTLGRPHAVALEELERVLADFPGLEGLSVTGSGARLLADVLGVPFVNEIVAQSKAAAFLTPQARTAIEIGGTESKLIHLARADDGTVRVDDFGMNAMCAAGTGSFLDQQASRLKVSIEEFSRMALRSAKPPRVAGRCSVFAKSDMIHLQQQGTADYDIVAGLCYAMARNFKSSVGMGKELAPPVAFQGGVALNPGMVRAFVDVLGLEQDDLIIPPHPGCTGALGAVLHALDEGLDCSFDGVEALREHLGRMSHEAERLPRLHGDGYSVDVTPKDLPAESGRIDAYVGVDVGSISTNVVVLGGEHNVIARRYLMTEGRPLEAVKKGLYEVGREVGDRVQVRGCATTGSGRYLTGAFIGADVIKNEITTHARGAVTADPGVDTIFEIGGQDAKYISLKDGAVVDFAMNKVCAAGTGSFLEEQAERLGLKIEEEFGSAALSSDAPCMLGERCTVFMESDLNYHQQRGVPRDDLVAGLCYSIVYNYLNRVVEGRRVGESVFFQGGVAFNRGVKAAFEAVLGKKVTVPPHQDILGAVGAAIIAHEAADGPSDFRGFDLREVAYELETFECRGCSNRCEIHRVSIEGRDPLHFGSRCGRFDRDRRPETEDRRPGLFAERERALLSAYGPDEPEQPIGVTVGIPRALTFFDLYPFWKAFFTEMGCHVVLSEPTNKETVRGGDERMTTETCLPIIAAHGHVAELIERGVDYVFVPSVVSLSGELPEAEHSYACPLAQSLPYLLRGAFRFGSGRPELLDPVFEFEHGRAEVEEALRRLGRMFEASPERVDGAVRAAWAALDAFRARLRELGDRALVELGPDEHAVVVVSRPYNGCDPGMNLALPDKLRDLGVTAIPMDLLPLDLRKLGREFAFMYWKYGQKILAAAEYMALDPRLHAVYVTNFRCGPDSFITKHFERLLGKPYLTIEVDQHSSDVGAITRCEAFIDSFGGVAVEAPAEGPPAGSLRRRPRAWRGRRIYVPHMDDHSDLLAAAFRGRGIEAEALPMSDSESVELGRRFTTGKECYPCILTTGDIIRATRRPGFDPQRSAFFMPEAAGPCRFGQYNHFQRTVLDDLGLDDVPIVVLDQSRGFAGDVRRFGRRFYRTCWQLVVILDAIQKMVREIRPYEVNRGETDRLYAEALRELAEAAARRGDLYAVARAVRLRLQAVETDRSAPRPLVGVVGEIYVRSHEFSNNFLVRRLEAAGAQVVMPTLQEWVSYTALERREAVQIGRHPWRMAREWLIEWVARWEERRAAGLFDGAVARMPREAPASDVVRLGSRYLHPSVKGEAILSMGRAIEYVHEGVHGLVNVAPFGCMPGAIVNGLLEQFRRDHDGLPVLKLAFDGVEQSGSDTLLQAFVHQARQRMTGRGAWAARAAATGM